MAWSDRSMGLSAEEQRLTRRALHLLGLFTLVLALATFTARFYTQLHQPLIVPKVVGLEETQARKVLSGKGLEMKLSKSLYDEHMPAGLISFQNPKANFYVKRGQVVEVVLSKGSPKVRIPSLVGSSFAQAQIFLAGAHLRVGRESLMNSTELRDQVLGQSPSPGEMVESYSDVDLLVSAGVPEPSYVMPDLVKKSLDKAFKVLRPIGVTIQKIKTEIHDDMEPEIVLSQDPLPGSRIQAKDGASFVISGKSDQANQKARYAKVAFDVPEGNPRRLQIDVLDSSGTRTIYNRMASPNDHVEVGVSVTGKATAQVYLNQEFMKEIPID